MVPGHSQDFLERNSLALAPMQAVGEEIGGVCAVVAIHVVLQGFCKSLGPVFVRRVSVGRILVVLGQLLPVSVDLADLLGGLARLGINFYPVWIVCVFFV